MNANRTMTHYRHSILFAIFATVSAATALAQYSDRYQINLVEQHVRSRIITDLRGSRPMVLFDDNAVLSSINYGRQSRVTGNGRYQANNSSWRRFSYEGLFDLRSGQVSSVSYDFTDDGSYRPPGQSDADFRWSGNVDDFTQIRVSGSSTTVNDISGRPTSGVNYNFNRALPRRPANVTLRKLRGRGNIAILEQPTARNNFTAVLEIRDTHRGADFYEFELDWANTQGRPPSSGGSSSNSKSPSLSSGSGSSPAGLPVK